MKFRAATGLILVGILSLLMGNLATAALPLSVLAETKLTASDGAAADIFGTVVAISGDTIVVGAPYDDDAGSYTGAVYVFQRNGSSWGGEVKLTASDAASNDEFGTSVAISVDTIVVGSPKDDDDGSRSGAAYVFQRSGANWNEVAKLTASDAAALDEFGSAVAISGDTVVVGAAKKSDVGSYSGAAYVFQGSGANWSEETKLTASDAASKDSFGLSAAIDGDTVVVGAPYADIVDVGSDAGAAYVFQRNDSNWSEEAKLTASDGGADAAFAFSVGIDGETVVVGAPYANTVAGGSDAGAAYVFQPTGGAWNEQAKLTASDGAAGDTFGSDVALAVDRIVVGTPWDDDDGSNSGSAYLFQGSDANWVEQGKFTADDATENDEFGRAVAISTGHVVAGAPQAGANIGAAYVYGNDTPPEPTTPMPTTDTPTPTPTTPSATSTPTPTPVTATSTPTPTTPTPTATPMPGIYLPLLQKSS